MQLKIRRYENEDDYWNIRAFLREVFLLNDRRELSWQVYRFDYWHWHGVENMGHGRLEEDVLIWETEEGQIAAVLNHERPVDAVLQVHPGSRTRSLEEQMVAAAEKRLAIPDSNGKRKLCVWCHEHDDLRKDILVQRGYTRDEWPEYQRRRDMSLQIPEVSLAEGFNIRALGGPEELPARSYASWRAFHPDEGDDAYEGWEWYKNIQRAPLYRRDLDIVAVAPDGDIASFCTIWFDDVARTGAFEPVGAAATYQQQGLGKAVMCEGLRCLKRMGATMAYVGSYSAPAHALYASVGFTDYELSEPWTKEMPS